MLPLCCAACVLCCLRAVADSAGANVLVAALAALRDCSSTQPQVTALERVCPAAAGDIDAASAASCAAPAADKSDAAAASAAATQQLFSGIRARLQQLGNAASHAPLLDAAVLVSPAMDLSSSACFHDEAWTAAHEER